MKEKEGPLGRIVHKLMKISLWHFIWISVILSELFTSIMSIILRGRITPDYLITGGVVSLIVASVVIILVKQMRENEKSLQEKVQESEGRYQSLVEHTTDAIIGLDLDGNIVSLNKGVEKMLGWKAEDIIGHSQVVLIPKEFIETCKEHLKEAILTGHVKEAESARKTRDGRIIPVATTLAAIYDDQGDQIGFVTIFRDISERKKAEGELKRRDDILDAVSSAAENFLRASSWEEHLPETLKKLGEAANVSRVYIFENHPDEDGALLTSQRYEWAAPATDPQIDNPDLQNFKLVEYGFGRWVDEMGRGEPIFGPIKDLPPSEKEVLELQDILSIVVVPIFVGDTWWGFIGFDECCSLDRVWSIGEINALKASADTLGAAIQRLRGEGALLESEERYRQLVELSPDGIVVHCEGKICFINSAGANIVGAKNPEELIGQPVMDFVHPDYREIATKRIQAMLKEGNASPLMEERFIRVDGGIIDVEVAAMPITFKDKPAVQVVVRDITERKEIEAELKESEEKYRLLAENSADVIWTLDMDLNVTYVSPSITRLLGYTYEEAMTKRTEDVFTPESLGKSMKALQDEIDFETKEVRDPSMTRTMELVMVRQDGSKVPVEVSYSYLLGEDRTPEGIMASARDITERKKAEEALKEREERLAQITNTIEDVFWITDWKDHRTLFASPAFEEIWGRSLENLYENPTEWADAILPEDSKRAWEAFVQLDEKDSYDEEYRIARPDGSIRWIRDRGFPIRNEEGSVYRVVGIAQDITERKRAEEAIKESEKKFRTVFENVNDMIVYVDKTGKILEINERAEDVFGFNRDDVIGKNFAKLGVIGIKELPQILKLFKDSVMKGKIINPVELVLTDKDGRKVPVEASTQLIKRDGKITGIVSIIRDITERKKAQDAIQDYANDLEDSNELKDLFIDIMHHDILNPAGIIRGAAQLMLDDDVTNKDILDIIVSNVNKQIRMVESASMLSKLRASGELEMESLYLKTVIDHVVRDIEPIFQASEMEIENRIAQSMPIRANSIIEDIFINILSNAVKYAPDGKVVIDAEELDGGYRVSITDNGPGIPDKEKEDIFTRFHREYKGGIKGSGLGLAIAKRIVDLHGGNIWVEDNPDGGSIFCVSLPKEG